MATEIKNELLGKYKAMITRDYVDNKLVHVESSNVDRIGIELDMNDDTLCSLIVKFKSGNYIYVYLNVKVSDVDAMRNSESIGKAMHKYIIPYYDFVKVEITDEN